MSKVWITRTHLGADETAEKLRQRGFDPLVAPLLNIVPPDNMPEMPPFKALLVFTSKNAVRAFCELTDCRHWDVVTVGDATAGLATQLGFNSVMSASGTSDDVTKLIEQKVSKNTPITHCAGANIRGSIIPNLQAAGYSATRIIFYKTVPVNALPNIDLKTIEFVLLHSPLAAQTLRNLNPNLSHALAISISEAADEELIGLRLREKRIANSPHERAIINALHA